MVSSEPEGVDNFISPDDEKPEETRRGTVKSTTQRAWLLGLLIASGADYAVQAQKVLTFDALPTGASFSSYTEDGITFAGSDASTVFLTKTNFQNGTTAIEITSSNTAAYSISMGGRYFSLRSFKVLAPAFHSPVVRSAFGLKRLTNGRTGVVMLAAGFENVTYVQFNFVPFDLSG